MGYTWLKRCLGVMLVLLKETNVKLANYETYDFDTLVKLADYCGAAVHKQLSCYSGLSLTS